MVVESASWCGSTTSSVETCIIDDASVKRGVGAACNSCTYDPCVVGLRRRTSAGTSRKSAFARMDVPSVGASSTSKSNQVDTPKNRIRSIYSYTTVSEELLLVEGLKRYVVNHAISI